MGTVRAALITRAKRAHKMRRHVAGPARTARNYGRLLDEDGKPIKQGQAYRRNLAIDELASAYENDLEQLTPEEMLVEWGTGGPPSLGMEAGGRITSRHLRSPMYVDTEYGFELTPKKIGSTKTWYIRAPNSIILRTRRAILDGEAVQANAVGSFAWPSPGDTLTLKRVYKRERGEVGDITATISQIFPTDLVACIRVEFETSVDSRRLTESKRGGRRGHRGRGEGAEDY